MQRDIRICAFGDSFVHGVGDPEGLGWFGRLCHALPHETHAIRCFQLGIPGNTSEDIRARWEAERAARILPGAEGYLIFSFGVNDSIFEWGTHRVAPERTMENARHILGTAKALHPTIMVGPPPIDDDEINERVEELDARLQTLCKELSIPYCSLFERLKNDQSWHTEVAAFDGAHPRAAGYMKITKMIGEWEGWQELVRF